MPSRLGGPVKSGIGDCLEHLIHDLQVTPGVLQLFLDGQTNLLLPGFALFGKVQISFAGFLPVGAGPLVLFAGCLMQRVNHRIKLFPGFVDQS